MLSHVQAIENHPRNHGELQRDGDGCVRFLCVKTLPEGRKIDQNIQEEQWTSIEVHQQFCAIILLQSNVGRKKQRKESHATAVHNALVKELFWRWYPVTSQELR